MLFNAKYRIQELIMNISDIIRGILTKLDGLQEPEQPMIQVVVEPEQDLSPLSMAGGSEDEEELRRIKQIAGLLPTDNPDAVFANEPNEQYADVDSVTVDAGSGPNKPKHPSDIRVQHPSMYPGHQHKVGE